MAAGWALGCSPSPPSSCSLPSGGAGPRRCRLLPRAQLQQAAAPWQRLQSPLPPTPTLRLHALPVALPVPRQLQQQQLQLLLPGRLLPWSALPALRSSLQ